MKFLDKAKDQGWRQRSGYSFYFKDPIYVGGPGPSHPEYPHLTQHLLLLSPLSSCCSLHTQYSLGSMVDGFTAQGVSFGSYLESYATHTFI